MENGAKTETRRGNLKLLIISYDVIGRQMAGPGIRSYEFAKILSNYIDVTLATPNKVDVNLDNIKNITYDLNNYRTLKRYVEVSDMILIQGHILYYFPFIKNFKGKIIIDLYNPFHLESLEMFRNDNLAERLRIDKNNLDILKFQVSVGDFFICASEKQRSYWLGMLNAMGRINPFSYDDDDTLKKLIDIVPFGIPSRPPQHTGESIRKIIPSLRPDDTVVLWGGGIWNWLDPITVIKAIWEITRSRKDIKLVFSGIKHPDPKLPEMKKCIDAINLSKELDLYDKFIFFNEWVPYEMRQNFLLESSAGLSIHQNKLETEFAYRTRVMDYVWAKLPIITTEGDSIAKMVKEENIGEVVKFENTHQLARVIESMLSNRSLKDIYIRNLEKLGSRFHWENVCKPLVEYCLQPYFAADKKKIMELLNIQNSKIVNIIKTNFSGATNTLVLTSNIFNDREILKDSDAGKAFYIEVGELAQSSGEIQIFDKIGFLKTKILGRTRFDGVIINNAFENITANFLYNLLNVIGMKLKNEGILFFSIPENRGILRLFTGEKEDNKTGSRIDEFTFQYILKNTGYEIITEGNWEKLQIEENTAFEVNFKEQELIQELYNKNELMDLFEIKLSRQDFKELSLLKGLNVLDSEELQNDRSIKGRIKRYLYAVASLYFENLRKSYNSSIQAINNNVQVQINREINELNKKNRERMIFIYYNIFKTLQYQISNLGLDIKSLRKIYEEKCGGQNKDMNSLDERLEVLLGDAENIDRIMGLTFTNKYYVAKKL